MVQVKFFTAGFAPGCGEMRMILQALAPEFPDIEVATVDILKMRELDVVGARVPELRYNNLVLTGLHPVETVRDWLAEARATAGAGISAHDRDALTHSALRVLWKALADLGEDHGYTVVLFATLLGLVEAYGPDKTRALSNAKLTAITPVTSGRSGSGTYRLPSDDWAPTGADARYLAAVRAIADAPRHVPRGLAYTVILEAVLAEMACMWPDGVIRTVLHPTGLLRRATGAARARLPSSAR